MKPIIGLPTSYARDCWTNKYYTREYDVNAIKKNGGIPILLPYSDDEEIIDSYFEIIDGLYLAGGDDVSPLTYGEAPVQKLGTTIKQRDDFEIALFDRAFKHKMPVLGICRGFHMINICMGGSIYQDIFSQVKDVYQHVPHDFPNNCDPSEPVHEIEIFTDTALSQYLGSGRKRVNSIHHQAINVLADKLIVSAKSDDGIIEGIEYLDEEQYILGVQWHPEIMNNRFEEFDKIFQSFIRKCEK